MLGIGCFFSVTRCIKVAYLDKTFVVFSFKGGTNLLNEDQFVGTKSVAPSSVRGNPRHESTCAFESFWVGHCIISHYYTKELSADKVTLKVVTMDLHQSASAFPEELLDGADQPSTLTVIHRSLPHR